MAVILAIVGSRGVFPSIGEIDIEVAKLPLPWDGAGEFPEAYRRVISHVVDGWANGGDYAGRLWADHHGITAIDEPITDDDVRRWGKYFAPKMRNRRVAELCGVGLALWDGRSSGTTDFVTRMVLRRKHVEIVPCKIVKGRPRRPRYPGATSTLPLGGRTGEHEQREPERPDEAEDRESDDRDVREEVA